MNFFQKLFCSHDYKYVGLVSRRDLLSTRHWKSPQFICEKCHKIEEIYGLELSSVIKKAKEKQQIKVALEGDLSEYDKYKVNTHEYGIFTGYVAYYIMSCYSDVYKKELEHIKKENRLYGIK